MHTPTDVRTSFNVIKIVFEPTGKLMSIPFEKRCVGESGPVSITNELPASSVGFGGTVISVPARAFATVDAIFRIMDFRATKFESTDLRTSL